MQRITFYVMFLLLIACQQQQQTCCDVDVVANIGWPSGNYNAPINYNLPESYNNPNNEAIQNNNNYSNGFDSSIEDMQPVHDNAYIAPNNLNETVDNTTNIVNVENNATEFVNDVVSNTTDLGNEIVDNSTTNLDTSTLDSTKDLTNDNNISTNSNNFSIKIITPSKIYLNNVFSYEIKIKNNSEVPLKQGTITHTVPDNVAYLSSNITPEINGSKIAWTVDEISPFASRSINVEVNGAKPGTAKFLIDALFDGNSKTAQGYTIIDASAGIKINHSDTIDPVEVDTATVYEIEIVNQGNKDAKNLKIVDIIPEETTFVNAKVVGAENIGHTVKGKKIVFDVLTSLPPGQKVVFKIEVEAIKEGDLLNTVEITTSDFSKTLTSQEGTTSFQE